MAEYGLYTVAPTGRVTVYSTFRIPRLIMISSYSFSAPLGSFTLPVIGMTTDGTWSVYLKGQGCTTTIQTGSILFNSIDLNASNRTVSGLAFVYRN